MSIFAEEPIHITVPADAADPRRPGDDPPGIVVHRVPALHPDDLVVIDGMRVTSVARTLIDLAEVMGYRELRGIWLRARRQGQLDMPAVRAARARVEWRPSLAIVDRLLEEFPG